MLLIHKSVFYFNEQPEVRFDTILNFFKTVKRFHSIGNQSIQVKPFGRIDYEAFPSTV